MNADVIYEPAVERVQLDLSLAEFAALEALRYNYLSQETPLRTSVDDGFTAARSQLQPASLMLVRQARHHGGNTRAVQDTFA